MGPNSSFLLLISMIIPSCHMAYVFFFFNLRRISVNEMTKILMKGIFHELYLFTHDISHPSLIPNTSLRVWLREVERARSNSMYNHYQQQLETK